jgi:hypothetical protein
LELDLEVKQTAFRQFVKHHDLILEEFTEINSGKRNNWIQLQVAIDLAKKKRATLLIAKLDRLSRNAAFIFTLRDRGADFVCADKPKANPLPSASLSCSPSTSGSSSAAGPKRLYSKRKYKGLPWANRRISPGAPG